MFWKAIADGLGQMTHWEIWVSILVYGIVIILFFFALGYTMMKNEDSGGVQTAGCLTTMIGGPLVQGILVAFLVTALLPILIGGDDFTPMEFVSEYWWSITKAGLLSMLITFLLTLVPLIGDFISKTPGTAIFVQGAIVFHMLANKALGAVLSQSGAKASLFPGFWVTIGFVLLSIIIVYIVSIIIIGTLMQLKVMDEYSTERYGFLIGNFVGVIPGILCLCIYCAYIRLTLIEATGNAGI